MVWGGGGEGGGAGGRGGGGREGGSMALTVRGYFKDTDRMEVWTHTHTRRSG